MGCDRLATKFAVSISRAGDRAWSGFQVGARMVPRRARKTANSGRPGQPLARWNHRRRTERLTRAPSLNRRSPTCARVAQPSWVAVQQQTAKEHQHVIGQSVELEAKGIGPVQLSDAYARLARAFKMEMPV